MENSPENSDSSGTSRSIFWRSGSDNSELHASDVDTLHVPSSVSYTSLKDLLPQQSATQLQAYNSSLQDIPIRDPLVKKAALSYLQPFPTSPKPANKGFFSMFVCDYDRGGDDAKVDCLGWLAGIIMKIFGVVHRDVCYNGMSQEDDREG